MNEKKHDTSSENLNNDKSFQTKTKIVRKRRLKKVYLGYKTKIITKSIIFAILICIATILISRSFSFTEQKELNYQEKSNIDYKVYLKENNYYETPYLDENMLYVASLIKNIDITFNYAFTIDEAINCDFIYDITGKLVIANESGKSIYFQKEYSLVNDEKATIENKKQHSLKKNVIIDYDYYNSLAKSFKAEYGLNTTSSLIVSLNIKKTNGNSKEEKLNINDTNTMTLTIPLSEKSIDIGIQAKEINNVNQITAEKKISIQDITYLVIGSVLLVIAIYYLVSILLLLSILIKKKSEYDKFIHKILKEYDRLIVETTSMPTLNNYEVTKVHKFSELLDVRDNLKLPIMYFTVASHIKSHFYIKYNKDIYILTLKAIDLEVQDEK